MPQLVHAHMSISLDGFGAGPNQTRERPFGDGDGEDLHRWMFEDAGNNQAEIEAIVDYGAFVMGRHMFGYDRGDHVDLGWRGWWGDNPPYHAPVFVLTHVPRPAIEMQGGTTFHFVTDGLDAAVARAREAAGPRDLGIAGGVSTLRQSLNAGHVDLLHLSLAAMLLHRGERLWDGLAATLEPIAARHTRYATHIDYRVAKS